MQKTCEICGRLFDPYVSNQRYCSKKCRHQSKKKYYDAEFRAWKREQYAKGKYHYNYGKDYHKRIATKVRIRKILYLGGKCAQCPENDLRTLEMHHVNGRKDTGGGTCTWDEIKSGEIVLLCGSCHNKEHADPNFLELIEEIKLELINDKERDSNSQLIKNYGKRHSWNYGGKMATCNKCGLTVKVYKIKNGGLPKCG